MKKCKKCDGEFEPSKGLINYCSFACRNSHNHTDLTKQKISKSIKKTISEIGYSKEWYAKICTHNISNGANTKLLTNEKLLNSDFNTLSFQQKRKFVKLHQRNCCDKCGISTWFEQPITLELEHVDGNTENNNRENLIALCPNCHSITPTWRGRNVSHKNVSDEQLVKSLIESNTISNALKNVNLSLKGGNYKRCYQLISKYNITNIKANARKY